MDAASLLVARAKAGDRRAFDELVRRYRKRIFALALHLCGSETEADDISQDVFLRAFHTLDQFEGRSEFFTWVYRLAVNRALDARRACARRSESSIDEPRGEQDADPRVERAVEVDGAGDPRRVAELRQTYACLLRALDALPAEMRTTVVLVELQGFSNAEAAVIQRCSRGTIAWRLHTARARLNEALARNHVTTRVKAMSAHLAELLAHAGLPTLNEA